MYSIVVEWGTPHLVPTLSSQSWILEWHLLLAPVPRNVGRLLPCGVWGNAENQGRQITFTHFSRSFAVPDPFYGVLTQFLLLGNADKCGRASYLTVLTPHLEELSAPCTVPSPLSALGFSLVLSWSAPPPHRPQHISMFSQTPWFRRWGGLSFTGPWSTPTSEGHCCLCENPSPEPVPLCSSYQDLSEHVVGWGMSGSGKRLAVPAFSTSFLSLPFASSHLVILSYFKITTQKCMFIGGGSTCKWTHAVQTLIV